VLTDKRYYRATWVIIGVSCYNTLFSGIAVLNIYSTTILDLIQKESDSGHTIDPKVGATLLFAAQVAACLIALVIGNRFGIRPIFIYGQLTMTVCLLLVGTFVYLNLDYLTFASMMIFVFTYQLTQGSFFISLISYIGN